MPQTDISAGELTIEDIYNLLLAEIEPDLTTHMIPMLDGLYEGESEKEKKRRGKRYAKAFKVFAKRFERAMSLWKQAFLDARKKVLGIMKEKSGKEDTEKLSDIERSLDNA